MFQMVAIERKKFKAHSLKMVLEALTDEPQDAAKEFNKALAALYGKTEPELDTKHAAEIMEEMSKKAYRITPAITGLSLRRNK